MLICINQSSFRGLNLSTTCKSASAEPTFPGKTMYGNPGHLLIFSSHLHKGTPGAAWPITSARRMRKALVAQSEEVIPPFCTGQLPVLCRNGRADVQLP